MVSYYKEKRTMLNNFKSEYLPKIVDGEKILLSQIINDYSLRYECSPNAIIDFINNHVIIKIVTIHGERVVIRRTTDEIIKLKGLTDEL